MPHRTTDATMKAVEHYKDSIRARKDLSKAEQDAAIEKYEQGLKEAGGVQTKDSNGGKHKK